KIGLKEAKSFPPGYVAVADKRGLKLKPIKVLKSPSISAITAEEAAEKLRKILEDSAKERVSGLKEVAVAFSGGLDSSLTALLAKKAGIKVHLVHVSLENRPETVQAKEAAALLDMPIHTYLYSEEDVEKVLPKVLWTVESPNPVKVSIGVPIFWTAEKAAEQGFRVLLTGQGADELFGGYRRYLNVYSRFGEKAVENALVHDALTMHENNFERDSKICAFHNIEPRLPFASYHLAEFALSLPLNLKIESKSDLLRKIVLRRVAEKLELPPQIVAKLKRAVQYATGTSKVIKKIARREKISVKQYLQKLFSKTFEGF
ncbi:MAG: asparagine synthase C-terminal domain-containing protein, partial [Candidatus Bathyarchaeia archaeon]